MLEDVRGALQGPHQPGVGFNRMDSELIIAMLEHLSHGFPQVRFLARGAGEELLDTWVREFHAGVVTVAQGPWQE